MIEELVEWLKKVKHDAEIGSRSPYLEKYELGCLDGRADAFDDTLRKIEQLLEEDLSDV